MSNAFDSNNYPLEVDPVLQKGDFWAWKKTGLTTDYPFSLYSVKYKFHHLSGSTPLFFTVTATEVDDEYVFSTSTTTSHPAGEYKWTAIVIRTSDSVEAIIGEGYVTVVDDAIRSHAKIVLDSIEAVIEGRANMDQASMSIAGRSLSRTPIEELLLLRSRYKSEWLKEVKLARLKNGKASGNTIRVQF